MADGAATIPSVTGSGLQSAHTDTLQQLVVLVQEKVDSPELTEPKVVRLINQGLLEIVAKLARRRVYLPSLLASAEVETAPTADVVPLPADYHANLHGAFDVLTGRLLAIKPWTALQRMSAHALILRGVVSHLAVYGQQLRYWMVPDAPRRIAIQYHRLPVPLVADIDKPFELPVELSTRLIVDYAAGEAFANLEQDMGGTHPQAIDCRARAAEALDVLAGEIGPWSAEAAPINDAMGWGGMW